MSSVEVLIAGAVLVTISTLSGAVIVEQGEQVKQQACQIAALQQSRLDQALATARDEYVPALKEPSTIPDECKEQ